MRSRSFPAISVVLLFIAAAHFVPAQDTRNVTEPRIPAPCVTLSAELEAHDGQLAIVDEQKLDTARIQDAIERCSKNSGAAGSAVVLKSQGHSAQSLLHWPRHVHRQRNQWKKAET